jgi:hypothetical protein
MSPAPCKGQEKWKILDETFLLANTAVEKSYLSSILALKQVFDFLPDSSPVRCTLA